MFTRTTAETHRPVAWIKSRTKVLRAAASAARGAEWSVERYEGGRDGEGRKQDVRIMFAEADRVRDVSRHGMTAAANTVLVGQCGDRS